MPARARGRTAVLRIYAPLIAGCFVVAWLVSLAWWLLLPEARSVDLTIPDGTGARLAAGRVSDVIPSALQLRRGDTLVVRNQDSATHRLGLYSFAPGTVTRIPGHDVLLRAPQLVCTFHPSGSLTVGSMTQPGILHTAIPTMLTGIPLSIVALVAVAVGRRLDEPRDQPAVRYCLASGADVEAKGAGDEPGA